MTAAWGLLAAVALLWPDRLAGAFDGVPLDRPAEALAVGVVFPVLWWLAPQFLRRRSVQILVLALIVWKLAATALLTQQGWCVRFVPQRVYVADQTGAPHAWDLRADWRSLDPACSAVMTRSYGSLEEFPAWFFNLPPADDGWPTAQDRPPGATTHLSVRGFLNVRQPGTLRFDTFPDVFRWSIDGVSSVGEARLGTGSHLVVVDADLTGDRWRFVPLWNEAELPWNLTTLKRPSSLDRLTAAWAGTIPVLLSLTLLVAWLIWALRRVGDPVLLGWSGAAAAAIAWLVIAGRESTARMGIVALVVAAALPLRARSRNITGMFIAIGVPWTAFVVACALPAVGRFVLYEVGHDYWMYQRFAYRIVMQGRWLEGGSAAFWFQPFYRWIAATLHAVFGDSSVGEWFWDGACLLAIALFTFEVTRRSKGFRWGIAAAVLPLAIFVVGTPQYLIGRGLGEISSAGLLAAAALCAMRSRHGRWPAAAAAGVLAALAFFTRLNNLPMAIGTSVFAYRRGSWRSVAVVLATFAGGVLAFALRTWYFTGEFGLFTGTQRNLLAIWQPGMNLRTGLARTADSVLMVLTVNDPPRFDPFAAPVLIGALAAVLAVLIPRLRTLLPLPAALFFCSGIAGAFIARGSAYPGRFSMHILGVTCALSMCALAALAARVLPRRPMP